MKSILIMILFAMAAPMAQAEGDRDIGNGGDDIAAQYYMTAENAVRAMETLGANKFPGINLVHLRDVINGAHVIATDKTLYGPDKKPRPTINMPDIQTIKFTDEEWFSFESSYDKVANSVHEIFGLAEIEKSDNYMLTYRTLKTLREGGVNIDGLLAASPIVRAGELLGSWSCHNPANGLVVRADITTLPPYNWRDSRDPNHYNASFRFQKYEMNGGFHGIAANRSPNPENPDELERDFLSCLYLGEPFKGTRLTREPHHGGYFHAKVRSKNRITFELQNCYPQRQMYDTYSDVTGTYWANESFTLRCSKLK